MKEVDNWLIAKAVEKGPEYLTGPKEPGKDLVLNKDGKPLRILVVGNHFCIRIIKQAIALKKRGYQVDAFTGKYAYGLENFDRVFHYLGESSFMEVTVRQFNAMATFLKDHYDIFHYHNEPDYPVRFLKACGCGPIVYDCHDLDSVRQNVVMADEVLAFKCSDAAVFVSKPVADWGVKLHKYKKPYTILYHFCNDGTVDYNSADDAVRHGIVYEGGANPPQVYEVGAFKYRGLYDLSKKIVEMGNDLTMYIGNMDAVGPYSDFGAHIFPPTVYPDMMRGLTKHKWGWCGFDNSDGKQRQVNMTLTNKMFEYITAGLPVIVYGAQETARLVNELGVGFSVNDLEELGNVETNYGSLYPTLKANVERVRKTLMMEKHVWKIENLYREILEKREVPEVTEQPFSEVLKETSSN